MYEDLNLVAEAISVYSQGVAALPASSLIRLAGETLVRGATVVNEVDEVFLPGTGT